MMSRKFIAAFVLASLAGFAARAADIPSPGPNDARIRVVEYKANEVTLVRVQRGVVTRIVLERDEKIEVPSVGFSSNCDSERDEWCVRADVGSNQVFVRPRDNARSNNMELRTNRRDYSFVFAVASDTSAALKNKPAHEQAFFRVVFNYAPPKPAVTVAPDVARAAAVDDLLRRVDRAAARPIPQAVDPDYGMSPVQRLRAEGVQVRNANYTKQVLDKGADADPVMVFDDGRFTYFEFPGAREIPAVFAHGSDGEATRVNWHMRDSFVVVQRTARKFTLRLGDAVVGVFNESFDPTGIDTPTATVSPAVVREIKGGLQ
ncbi:MAG: TrbG/VirB9 family P-type conjugative transfer protein [Casimicrobium sp.]